ncbi:cytidylate kinase family protein [Candidatus Dojkabacteria bacterium]|nr:cytidylate kinase family protein [Candidatus Dojkabacteria bacterium]
MVNNKFNITVASWPGTGSTTLALILSYVYKLKYFYSGAVFRYFSKELGYKTEGKIFSRNENKYSVHLDTLVDDYSVSILDKGGYVINTKPLGFLVNRADTFNIFLHANIDTRAKRAYKDGREGKTTIKNSLLIRQKAAGKRYKSLYGIDWEDKKTLKEKHDLVIDTSKLSIQEELQLVDDEIRKKYKISPVREFKFGNLSPKEIKDKAEKLIEQEKMEHTPVEAIAAIYENFKERIQIKPLKIRSVFEKTSKITDKEMR